MGSSGGSSSGVFCLHLPVVRLALAWSAGELYIVFDVEFPQKVPESLHAKFREILPQPESTPMVSPRTRT